MKYFYLVILLNLIFACSEQKSDSLLLQPDIIPDYWVLSSDSNLTIQKELLLLQHEKFSGFIYELAENKKDTLFYNGYLNGLLHGLSKKWYSNNNVLEIRGYEKGKKQGKQISFWENGLKRFEFTANQNQYEGRMQEWDISGRLTHLSNYKNGQEFGEQKMWNTNGKIRSNYIIKNGRRYGLLGTKNCVNVSDSISLIR